MHRDLGDSALGRWNPKLLGVCVCGGDLCSTGQVAHAEWSRVRVTEESQEEVCRSLFSLGERSLDGRLYQRGDKALRIPSPLLL